MTLEEQFTQQETTRLIAEQKKTRQMLGISPVETTEVPFPDDSKYIKITMDNSALSSFVKTASVEFQQILLHQLQNAEDKQHEALTTFQNEVENVSSKLSDVMNRLISLSLTDAELVTLEKRYLTLLNEELEK